MKFEVVDRDLSKADDEVSEVRNEQQQIEKSQFR
jgi:hypothetical protein